MKYRLVCSDDKLYPELMDLMRAYYPYIEEGEDGEALQLSAYTTPCFGADILVGRRRWHETQPIGDDSSALLVARHFKWFVKRTLYMVLQSLCGQSLPYGSLTGIRPTKLYYELRQEYGSDQAAQQMLKNYFFVSSDKVRLVTDIVLAQAGIYGRDTHRLDHFANIPICPTRCAYCSFIAETYSKVKKQVAQYAANLSRDVQGFFELGVPRRAIYVGGGTPTALDLPYLQQVLQAFDAHGEEFTLEAGRPETITPEVADVLQEAGVTRVSVNPQTFNQNTLQKIGRAHTVQDILRAYETVRGRFDVNMDLIAMLPDESIEDFADSVQRTIALRPANITVHSLSVKRGSVLALAGYDNAQNNRLALEMSAYAYEALTAAGYTPYYMYRQKNTQGRLENVGYTLAGKACVYNVDIMEETHSVHASGAGAISKRVYPQEGRIERYSEIKEVKGFNERIKEILRKKKEFFEGINV